MTGDEQKAWEELVVSVRTSRWAGHSYYDPVVCDAAILAADAELKRLNMVLDCWEQWACPELYSRAKEGK